MKKRILALFIVFVLSFSLIGTLPVFAATKSDVNLMYDLGIVKKIVKTGLFETGYTRGDFARSIVMLDKTEPVKLVSEESEIKYASDIDGNEYYHEISTVIAVGYMKTDDQKCFRPSHSLTLDDALYALVNALGYDFLANRNSGNEAAYQAVAQKIGLMKNVKVTDPKQLTADEVAAILANAMGVRFFSAGNVNLSESCFYDRWDLTKMTGEVYANSNMGISGEKASYKKVNIDGKLYYTEILIPDEMIGAEVTFYVSESNGDEEIVSIYSTFSEDSDSVVADEIAYSEEKDGNVVIHLENEEEIEISKNGFAIVNGKTLTPSKELFDLFKTGTATFLDSDRDGEYDLVNISLMVQKVIGGLTVDSKVMVDFFTDENIDFSKADNFEVYLNKRAASFSDLKEGYVVGICCDSFNVEDGKIVYGNENAETIKLYASSKTVSAEVEELSEDKIILGDMDYSVSAGYTELIKSGKMDALKINDRIHAYFDMFGNLAYYVLNEGKSRFDYGYLIISDISNHSAFSNENRFKIMDTKGNVGMYVSDEKFVLDGTKVESGSTSYAVGGETVDLTKRQVVRYYAEDGLLKELDTKAIRAGVESKENSLSEDIPFDPTLDGGEERVITRGVVEKMGAITKDTIYFVDSAAIDETSPSDDDFWVSQVATPNSFTEDDYFISCYDVDDDMKIACFVRYALYGKEADEEQINSASYASLHGMLVEKVTQAVNEKGEAGYNIYLAGNNEHKAYFAASGGVRIYAPKQASDWGSTYVKLYKINNNRISEVVKPGDVIRIDTNKYGEINYIEKLFDFTANKNTYIEVPSDKSGHIYGFAKLEKTNSDYIIYSYNTDDKYVAMRRTTYTTIPVFYVEKGKIEMLSCADIPTAAKGKDVRVFLRFYKYGDCRDHMIYVYD